MKYIEQKIMFSGGRVIEAKVMPDGGCLLTVEMATITAEDTTNQQREGLFKLVPASQLSHDDDFLKYQPMTKQEQNFKDKVENAIKSGLKEFWSPVCDTSFDDNGHNPSM